MELKSGSFTSKEPHVAREPQVADPWPIIMLLRSEYTIRGGHHVTIFQL
jgi:hypothetical protein